MMKNTSGETSRGHVAIDPGRMKWCTRTITGSFHDTMYFDGVVPDGGYAKCPSEYGGFCSMYKCRNRISFVFGSGGQCWSLGRIRVIPEHMPPGLVEVVTEAEEFPQSSSFSPFHSSGFPVNLCNIKVIIRGLMFRTTNPNSREQSLFMACTRRTRDTRPRRVVTKLLKKIPLLRLRTLDRYGWEDRKVWEAQSLVSEGDSVAYIASLPSDAPFQHVRWDPKAWVCDSPTLGVIEECFYMYDYCMTTPGVWMPFSDIEMRLLNALRLCSTQHRSMERILLHVCVTLMIHCILNKGID
ncbi:phosphoketolase family protein [Sesbania bispinosa]|nr:phosphoketolase family protein [Sesbania bispinosa]